MLLSYDEKEVLRYLGYRGKPAERNTLTVMDEVYGRLLTAAEPRYIYKEYEMENDGAAVTLCGVRFESAQLSRHLADCRSAILFGATLGAEADRLIKRYLLTDTARAAVAQAVAASMTESLCDNACAEISKELKARLTYRYSPGYGDLQLHTQRDFFALLPMTLKLGVSLSDSLLMTPSKSVTAFLGRLRG